MRKILTLGFLAMTALGAPPPPSITLTLTPVSGTVTGLPGSIAGWGYTIANNSTQYMVIVNSYFCEAGQDPLFTTCTQSLGAFSDFIAVAGTVIPPQNTVARTFNNSSRQGLGGYAIGANAAGHSDAGSIVVVYDFYTANPFTDPSATLVGGDIELTASAAVQVPALNTFGAPALSTWGLLALALLLMAFATRRLGTRLLVLAAAIGLCTQAAHSQPSLGGTIKAKTGPPAARVWTFEVGNRGPGIAAGVEIAAMTLVQTGGPACTRAVLNRFPQAVGDIAPETVASVKVTIDFSSCAVGAVFKATAALTANHGAAAGSIVRLNQFP